MSFLSYGNMVGWGRRGERVKLILKLDKETKKVLFLQSGELQPSNLGTVSRNSRGEMAFITTINLRFTKAMKIHWRCTLSYLFCGNHYFVLFFLCSVMFLSLVSRHFCLTQQLFVT